MRHTGLVRLRELTSLFLRLGLTAFGGPAAHIAMMHHETVRRREWLDERRFLDLVGATNLIPGPNSTELAMYVGYTRARYRGLVVAGFCFILPAALMVTALAWAYMRYGTTPAATGLLYGVKPVVVAIIAWALLSLVRTALSTRLTFVLAAAALTAYLLGVNELLILFTGGLVAVLLHLSPTGSIRALPLAVPFPASDDLLRLFLTTLKIGSVLYGSGYVILAFLRGDFVHRLGWLTEQQLLDATSIGQLTPGPLFTTATFVGYVAAGFPGALLATIGIFLPSFLLMAALVRYADRLRDRPWTSAMLDGVNATALALMAGVSLQLGEAALVDPLTIAIALVSLLLLWRTTLNSAWLIAAGAAIGLATTF